MKKATGCDLVFICENCAEPVTLTFRDDPFAAFIPGGRSVTVFHDGCDLPTVKMITDNPRKLSVVTSST